MGWRHTERRNKVMTVKSAKTLRTLLLVVAVIAFFAGLAFSTRAAYERSHDPKKVTATVVKMKSGINEQSGRYCVELEFEIKNKNASVLQTVSFNTGVYDKSGNLLGTISSSFGEYNNYLSLKKGDSVTLKTTLEEIRLDNDEFFAKLYESKKSDLKFVCKAEYVQFENK